MGRELRGLIAAVVGMTLTAGPIFGQAKEQQLPDPQSVPTAQTVPAAQTAPVPPSAPDGAAPASIAPGFLRFWDTEVDSSRTPRWWVSTDYMIGFIRTDKLPPLVTTSPAGTKQGNAGVIGAAGTKVLYGENAVGGDLRSGFNIGGGAWFDQEKTLGFNTGFFAYFNQNTDFNDTSNGSTIIARPFLDANSGKQSSLLVAFPAGTGALGGGKAAGSINVEANSGPFYSFHFDFQENIIRDPGFQLNSLLGYRFLRFNDSLQIRQDTNVLTGPLAGSQLAAQDNFNAQNAFNGCEIGLQADIIRERWTLGLLTKVAVGQVHRDIDIFGNTQVTAGGVTTNSAGGLLALANNLGNHVSNDFTAVPEIGLKLSWDINDRWRLTAGYSLLYWFNVVRAGDQTDTSVNSNLLNPKLAAETVAGPSAHPFFSLSQSNMWIQSINLGLEFRF